MRIERITQPIVVNVSGGRTSAYGNEEVKKLELKVPLHRAFNDTGVEHNATYDFLRNIRRHMQPDLICLQGHFDPRIGVGPRARVVDASELYYNPEDGPFAQMVKKYGIPTKASAWCTTRLKEETHRDYFKGLYGKDGYYTFLGIRADEPKRLVGFNQVNRQVSLYTQLIESGLTEWEMVEMFRRVMNDPNQVQAADINPLAKDLLQKRVEAVLRQKIIFLAEISDADKSDVNDFWSKQPFDLGIPDYLGNCVFCLKKAVTKVALAARMEPVLAERWINMIEAGSDRLNVGNELPKGPMYRGKLTLGGIIARFATDSDEELRARVKSHKPDLNSGCSESCEGFTGEVDNEW